MDQVRLEFRGKLAILALANPDGNRMNTAVLNGLRSALPQIRTSGATALLAIGDGSVFSYGADVAEMLTQPPEKALPIVADYMAVIAEIEAMPIPTIAAVHGVCSSGGLEFALAFDQLCAAAGTKIGFLEPLIFIPPLAGGIQRIAARAGRSRALEVTTAGASMRLRNSNAGTSSIVCFRPTPYAARLRRLRQRQPPDPPGQSKPLRLSFACGKVVG
jgi:enoyl-CoA hydratase/carnithine racemase